MASILKLINTALASLNPRQKEVVVARFGLSGGEGETLAAIGERMHITRERVRQIENGAVAIIKTSVQKSLEMMTLVEKIKKFIAAKGGVSKKSDVVRYAATLAPGIKENHTIPTSTKETRMPASGSFLKNWTINIIF